jgi:hypothetical protein
MNRRVKNLMSLVKDGVIYDVNVHEVYDGGVVVGLIPASAPSDIRDEILAGAVSLSDVFRKLGYSVASNDDFREREKRINDQMNAFLMVDEHRDSKSIKKADDVKKSNEDDAKQLISALPKGIGEILVKHLNLR